MRRPLILAVVLALVAAPVAGQPYRWVDENGAVHYADRPPRPAPANLENMNPAARQRRSDSTPPISPTAPKSAPEPPPAVTPAPEAPKSPANPPAPTTAAAPAPTERAPATPAVVAPAPAAPAPAPRETPTAREGHRGLAREVMDLAGIDRYVEDLARTAQGDLARLAWSTREPNAAWAALAPVFRRDVVAAATATALTRRLETEHLPALMLWLHSPEHEQIRQAELDAAKPANHRLYRRFVAGLAEPNVKLPHLTLVQQLDRVGRGADRHVALERALRQAMRRAVAPLAVRAATDDDEDDTSTRAVERTRFWFVTGTLFAYRGLGSTHIEAAVRFERSPAGVWFTTMAWESLDEAVGLVEQRASAAIRSVAARSVAR